MRHLARPQVRPKSRSLRNLYMLLQPDDVPMSLIDDDEVRPIPSETSTRHHGWFTRYQHFLFPIAGIAIALLAVYVLENLLQHTSRKETLAALHNMPWAALWLAVFFT